MAKKIQGETKEVEATLMGGTLDLQTEIDKQNDGLKSAIQAGDVIARLAEVKRNVEGKPYRKQYLQLVPTNAKGVYAINATETTWKSEKDKDGKDISDFDGACWVKDFFYGNDLGVKNKESQRLAVLVEGPDKAKQAAAKQLAKAFNITEEEAMRKIEAMGQ